MDEYSPIAADELAMWHMQVRQFPKHGNPGTELIHVTSVAGDPLDVILYRGPSGEVHGILNRYADGTMHVMTSPTYREGAEGRLILEAITTWMLDPEQQTYSRAGLYPAEGVMRRVW